MLKFITALSLTAVLTACAGHSQTTTHPHHGKDKLALFAAHHSPEVTAAWFFKKQDLNDDGVITPAERAEGPFQSSKVSFSKIDLNKDGKVTKAEYIEVYTTHHRRQKDQSV